MCFRVSLVPPPRLADRDSEARRPGARAAGTGMAHCGNRLSRTAAVRWIIEPQVSGSFSPGALEVQRRDGFWQSPQYYDSNAFGHVITESTASRLPSHFSHCRFAGTVRYH
eukprot:756013-Hanusia_phi.AAC.4